MGPIAISGFETEQANVKRLLFAGGVIALTVWIFFATLSPPKKRSS